MKQSLLISRATIHSICGRTGNAQTHTYRYRYTPHTHTYQIAINAGTPWGLWCVAEMDTHTLPPPSPPSLVGVWWKNSLLGLAFLWIFCRNPAIRASMRGEHENFPLDVSYLPPPPLSLPLPLSLSRSLQNHRNGKFPFHSSKAYDRTTLPPRLPNLPAPSGTGSGSPSGSTLAVSDAIALREARVKLWAEWRLVDKFKDE